MMTIKTGCAVYFENERIWLDSSDVHVLGDVIIVYSAHYTYDDDDLNYDVALKVRREAKSFVRQFDPDAKRAVAVVLQEDCVVSPEMARHLQQYYPSQSFHFQKEERFI